MKLKIAAALFVALGFVGVLQVTGAAPAGAAVLDDECFVPESSGYGIAHGKFTYSYNSDGTFNISRIDVYANVSLGDASTRHPATWKGKHKNGDVNTGDTWTYDGTSSSGWRYWHITTSTAWNNLKSFELNPKNAAGNGTCSSYQGDMNLPADF